MNNQKAYNTYLSNLSVMIFKLHNIHWNVKGFHFVPVHEFTEMVYDKLFEYVDEVAELQKMFGHTPASTLTEYLELATIKEEPTRSFTDRESIEILVDDLTKLKDEATSLRNIADEEGWFTSVALFEGHVEFYVKQLWFLNSMLG